MVPKPTCSSSGKDKARVNAYRLVNTVRDRGSTPLQVTNNYYNETFVFKQFTEM